MSKEEKVGKTLPEIVGVLVRCYNYGSGFYNEPGFYDNLSALFEHFGYVYDERSETQGGLVLSKAAANKATEEGELLNALEKIAAIEDKSFGGDWDEIEEAREIARQAIAADRASRQVANKAEVEPGFDQAKLMQLVREFAEVCYGVRRTTEDVGGKLVDYVKSLATPPATTGASTAPVDGGLMMEMAKYIAQNPPSLPDHACRECVGDGDLVKGDFRCTYHEALAFLAKPVGASTVLTDERIAAIWHETACAEGEGTREHPAVFARAIERDVAAQAGQVAVPEDVLRVVRRLLDGSQPQDVPGALMVIDTALAGGAA